MFAQILAMLANGQGVQVMPDAAELTSQQAADFLTVLEDWDIDGLIIGGVELICCVLYAALGAEERGFHYVVPQDIVSGMRSSEQVANSAGPRIPAVSASVRGQGR